MVTDHEVVGLLDQMIAIDSSNPSMSPDGPGEAAMAAFISEWAKDSGLNVDVQEQTPGRPNLLIRGGRGGGGPTLLLCGHMDTVGLADMVDPLVPRRDGDRLFGRGAYDMKGALAAALVACRDAHRGGIGGEVIVAAVADEEFASLGIREVLPHVVADAAIVVEPTELEIAIAHKGFVWMEIEVEGVAAHGSRPHLGVDAIAKIGPILTALDSLNERLADDSHPDLGPANVHASMIAGGVEPSTIPGRCLLTIERRTLPGETASDIEREVAGLLERCAAADAQLNVFSRTTLVRNPLETPRDEEIVGALLHSTASFLGKPADIGAVSFWADSAFISEAGIPTALFGPIGDGAHGPEEWVSINSLVACTQVLTDVARNFCG